MASSSSGHDPVTGVHAVIDSQPPGGPTVDGALHVDADLVCPRCLTWIAPDHYVRRTLTGLIEHESCPRSPGASDVEAERP
jgi:hypothetical protein